MKIGKKQHMPDESRARFMKWTESLIKAEERNKAKNILHAADSVIKSEAGKLIKKANAFDNVISDSSNTANSNELHGTGLTEERLDKGLLPNTLEDFEKKIFTYTEKTSNNVNSEGQSSEITEPCGIVRFEMELTEDTLDTIKSLALEKEISTATVVRNAIQDYLNKQ